MSVKIDLFENEVQDIRYNNINVMRYMGTKRKLLKFIVPELYRLTKNGDTIFDLMAGTNCVGYSAKSRNRIIANDIQWYSFVISKAIIENNIYNITREDIDREILPLYEENKTKKTFSLFLDNYSDTYFSLDQCLDIDSIRFAIENISNRGRDLYKKNLYFTCLMSAMGYAQSTPGHFAQYMPKDHPRVAALRELSIMEAFIKKCFEFKIVFSDFENEAFREDWRTFFTKSEFKHILKETSIFYIDPPYSVEQYSRFYHLLDTLILYDYPTLEHKGLYRTDRYKSNFCYKNKAHEEFDELVHEIQRKTNANVILSYSNTGVISKADLLIICRKYFKQVALKEFAYPHSTQGKGNSNHVKEFLITCLR